MNIIIKLDKRRWEEMQYTKKYEPTTMNWYEEQIVNGTPLPKGHGRLFDERDIVNGNYEIIGNRIYELEPIIEADKTESEDE